MGGAAVDEVDFFGAGVEGSEGGGDFGDHAAGDGLIGDEFLCFRFGEGVDEGGGVFGVGEEAGDVGEVDEFRGLKGFGEGGSGEIGVDVERVVGGDLASEGGDDGNNIARGGVEDFFGEAGGDFADEADVLAVGGHAGGLEDVGAGDAGGTPAEVVEKGDEFGIEGVGEGFFDEGDGFFSGDAKAFDPVRSEAGIGHGGGDGFAAPVDEDGVDASDFEEEDVAHEVGDELFVFHDRAADFDEEGLGAEALEVGEGLDEGGGFGLGVGHWSEELRN